MTQDCFNVEWIGRLQPLSGDSKDEYDARRVGDDFAERARQDREARFRAMGAEMGKMITVWVHTPSSLQLPRAEPVWVSQSCDVAGLRRVVVERGGLEYAPFGIRLPNDRALASDELLAEAGIGDGTRVEVSPEVSALEGAVIPERRTVEFAVAAAVSREARFEALFAQGGERARADDAFQQTAAKDRKLLAHQLANLNLGRVTPVTDSFSAVETLCHNSKFRLVNRARLMALDIASRQSLYSTGGDDPILSDDALGLVLPLLSTHKVDAAEAIGDFVSIRRAEVQPLLLTLHLAPPDPEGRLAIIATDMAGSEQAAVDADAGEQFGKVREELAQQIGRHARSISLMLANGRQLSAASDAQLLSEVSAVDFEQSAGGEGARSSGVATCASWAESEASAIRQLVKLGAGCLPNPRGGDVWAILSALAVLVDGDSDNLALARDAGAVELVDRVAGYARDAQHRRGVEAQRRAYAQHLQGVEALQRALAA